MRPTVYVVLALIVLALVLVVVAARNNIKAERQRDEDLNKELNDLDDTN